MIPIYNTLLNSGLNITEKVDYIKARCLISQLNKLSNSERNEYEQTELRQMFIDGGNTIKLLNNKIEKYLKEN